jgi:hypothetical protein
MLQLPLPASAPFVTGLQSRISGVCDAFYLVNHLQKGNCRGKSSLAFRRWSVDPVKSRLLSSRSGTYFSGEVIEP